MRGVEDACGAVQGSWAAGCCVVLRLLLPRILLSCCHYRSDRSDLHQLAIDFQFQLSAAGPAKPQPLKFRFRSIHSPSCPTILTTATSTSASAMTDDIDCDPMSHCAVDDGRWHIYSNFVYLRCCVAALV